MEFELVTPYPLSAPKNHYATRTKKKNLKEIRDLRKIKKLLIVKRIKKGNNINLYSPGVILNRRYYFSYIMTMLLKIRICLISDENVEFIQHFPVKFSPFKIIVCNYIFRYMKRRFKLMPSGYEL